MWSSVRQIKEAHHCLDVLCLKLTEDRLGSLRRCDKLAYPLSILVRDEGQA
jgi:hypothetical protein